jgi:hypothetical protein
LTNAFSPSLTSSLALVLVQSSQSRYAAPSRLGVYGILAAVLESLWYSGTRSVVD